MLSGALCVFWGLLSSHDFYLQIGPQPIFFSRIISRIVNRRNKHLVVMLHLVQKNVVELLLWLSEPLLPTEPPCVGTDPI